MFVKNKFCRKLIVSSATSALKLRSVNVLMSFELCFFHTQCTHAHFSGNVKVSFQEELIQEEHGELEKH